MSWVYGDHESALKQAMTRTSESEPTPPHALLTPEEQHALLADLAAAFAVEFSLADHVPLPRPGTDL
jgi:hypothetical protein